jgi:hypothetical protein
LLLWGYEKNKARQKKVVAIINYCYRICLATQLGENTTGGSNCGNAGVKVGVACKN